MPIHVDIKINDKLINTIHIGRLRGGTHPDNVNTYLVVEGKNPETPAEWYAGVEYTHRYGDGAEVCVMKALKALKTSKK
jgi:hypothetical protein